MTKVGNRKKYDYKILDNLNNALGAYKFIILQNLQGLFQRNHNEYVSKISEAGLNWAYL